MTEENHTIKNPIFIHSYKVCFTYLLSHVQILFILALFYIFSVTIFLIFSHHQGCTLYNETISSLNGIGKTGQPRAKECNSTTVLHHAQKINSEWIKDSKLKILEENKGGNKLLDIHLGDDCLNLTSKAKATKSKIQVSRTISY